MKGAQRVTFGPVDPAFASGPKSLHYVPRLLLPATEQKVPSLFRPEGDHSVPIVKGQCDWSSPRSGTTPPRKGCWGHGPRMEIL